MSFSRLFVSESDRVRDDAVKLRDLLRGVRSAKSDARERFPADEVERMLLAKRLELQPLVDAARAKYPKPLCIDTDDPVAGSAEKSDT